MNLLYRFTSIARLIDPRYSTNRAVLFLLPAAAGVAGAMAWLRGSGLPGIGEAALLGVAAVVGGWSLARELAPDLERVAFLSLFLTFGAFLAVESSSLLLLFTAVFLVRTVNRTVGLPCVSVYWSLPRLRGRAAPGSTAKRRPASHCKLAARFH